MALATEAIRHRRMKVLLQKAFPIRSVNLVTGRAVLFLERIVPMFLLKIRTVRLMTGRTERS